MARGTLSDSERAIAARDFALESRGLLEDVDAARLQNIMDIEAANEQFFQNRRTIGDLGPMAGAILAGAAAAPFTGGLSLAPTLAVLGGAGAVGGGAGSLIGQQFDAREGTDLGNVLQEALISGTIGAATGGLGRAFQVGRAGGSFGQLAGASGDDISRLTAQAKAQTAGRAGAVGTRGRNLRLDTLKPQKALSKGEVSPFNLGQIQDDVLRFDAQYLPAGSIQTKVNALGKVSDDLVKQADDVLGTVKSKTNIESLRNRMQVNLRQRGLLETAADERRFVQQFNKIVSDSVDDVNNISATQVNAVRREINRRASGIYGKAARGVNTTAPDDTILAMKESVDDVLESIVPKNKLQQFRNINSELRVSNDVAKSLFGQLDEVTPGAFGISSGGAGRAFQGVRDRAGRLIQGVGGGAGGGGRVSGAIAQGITGRSGQAFGQVAGREIAGLLDQFDPNDPTDAAIIADIQEAGLADGMGDAMVAFEGLAGFQQQPQTQLGGTLSDPAVIQQLMFQDLATTGGENIGALKTIMEIGQMAQPQAQELSTSQQKAVTQFASAEAVLDELLLDFQEAGGGQGRVGGTISNILGTIGFDDETRSLTSDERLRCHYSLEHLVKLAC